MALNILGKRIFLISLFRAASKAGSFENAARYNLLILGNEMHYFKFFHKITNSKFTNNE
jgi:hypothetical protein